MTFAVPKNDFLILEIIFFLWVLLSIFFSQFPFEYSFSLSIHWTVRISLITVHSFKKCSKLYNIICMNICNIYSKNNSKMNLPLVLLIYLKGVVRVRPLSHSPPDHYSTSKLHLRLHSPSVCRSWGQDRPKPGNRGSVLISQKVHRCRFLLCLLLTQVH